MSTQLSRRAFIKAGLATAGAVAASGIPAPQRTQGAGTELGTLLDLSKCIACGACVEACRDINISKFPRPEGPMPAMLPRNRVKIADWSSEEKQAVDDRLTPYNWLFIQQAFGEYNGEEFEINIPRRCMHCRNAPCSNLCPFGAAFTQSNGIVRIHPDVCMGGAKCKAVCPWHIPERQSGVGLHLDLLPQYAGNGVMYKCDRCYQRIQAGDLPACIEVCPEDVQEIGPRDAILEKARQLAQSMDGFIYGAVENGGTNTVYVSPVPFDVLNRAIEQGPGSPHLEPVPDAMASANKMALALAVAPLAGVAGAVIRFFSLGKGGAQ